MNAGSRTSLNEADFTLLLSYAIDRDETVPEAIVNAFSVTDVEVFDGATTLQDWIDRDALERLGWQDDPHLRLSTRIWDHHVVITSEAVRIFTHASIE